MGRLAARNLAAQGKQVAALDVDIDGLKETADGHDGILTIPTDVTDPSSVENAVRRCEQELGPIDRVYNAAAIMPTGPSHGSRPLGHPEDHGHQLWRCRQRHKICLARE